MQEETPEYDEFREENNSIGEDGGRSEGRYETHEINVVENDIYEE